MPTYQYQCQACEHVLEDLQNINDEPLTLCPKCAHHTLKREIGGQMASFRFKGSGFYITDYVKKNRTSDSDNTSGSNKENSK